METREQTEAKIEFFIHKLTDEQARAVVGFMRSFVKKNEREGVNA